ncbi:hypothetical protein [Frigoriglobus tundricola]|uniref:Uncharacterized protein n=1 Tax=Frigoriglobus tundricola TaxID=2774151 RepID=A0A6M5YLJ2_9BACT|nr:hypothetical protein [Frigoriglobus tundricola]QJW94897.1 hypothetical protein FTUN_2423 [Frigoriglobus tundricola]
MGPSEKQPVRSVKDATLAPTAPFEPTDYAKQLARNKEVAAAVGRDLDPFLQTALARLGDEFLAISEPLRWWITKLSAVHEEGRLTEVQRMELRLRLSELESKFQTAGQLLNQLNVL